MYKNPGIKEFGEGEKKGRCRWQWEEREGSVEGGECMGIQCKGLANLSDLSHCPTLKASASIVRARGGKVSL